MDATVAVYRPEYRPLCDPGSGEPCVECEHSAAAAAAIWNGYFLASAVLVGLGIAKVEGDAAPDVRDIGYI
jgi:hypothetical protein